MKTRSTVKICAILVGATLQGILINAVCNHFGIGSNLILANETPEPGSCILFGMAAIAMFRKRRNSK